MTDRAQETRPDLAAAVPTRRRRAAAWTLLLLTPVVAELALGSTPFSMFYLLVLWIPIYGAGVLLIREAVRRVGGGWPSLVLLGVVYELFEDGLGLQALTSPHLYGAADWGPRVLGLNTTYWEANAVYHVAFSILIPILLVDLIFPDLRHRPYLRRGGLIWTSVTAVIGIGLVRISVPPTMDPGYQAPWPYLVGFVVVGAVLAWIALRVLPARRTVDRSRPTTERPPHSPHPYVLGVLGAVGTLAFMFCVFPLGPGGPAFTSGDLWTLVPMAIGLLIVVAAGVLVVRWSSAAEWSARHWIWLTGGALLAHTGYGSIMMAKTPLDRVGLLLMAVLTVVFLIWLNRRVHRQVDASS